MSRLVIGMVLGIITIVLGYIGVRNQVDLVGEVGSSSFWPFMIFVLEGLFLLLSIGGVLGLIFGFFGWSAAKLSNKEPLHVREGAADGARGIMVMSLWMALLGFGGNYAFRSVDNSSQTGTVNLEAMRVNTSNQTSTRTSSGIQTTSATSNLPAMNTTATFTRTNTSQNIQQQTSSTATVTRTEVLTQREILPDMTSAVSSTNTNIATNTSTSTSTGTNTWPNMDNRRTTTYSDLSGDTEME